MTAKYEKLHIGNNPIDHPRLKQPFISCPLGLLSDTLCPALSFPICGEIFKFKPISFDQPLALLSPSVPITMFIKFGHISMYISPFDEIFEQYSHPGYKRCRWSSSQSLSGVNLDGKLLVHWCKYRSLCWYDADADARWAELFSKLCALWPSVIGFGMGNGE